MNMLCALEFDHVCLWRRVTLERRVRASPSDALISTAIAHDLMASWPKSFQKELLGAVLVLTSALREDMPS